MGHDGHLLQPFSKLQWSAGTVNLGGITFTRSSTPLAVPGSRLVTVYQWPPGHNPEGQYSGHLVPRRLLSDILPCQQVLLKTWSAIKLARRETVFWSGREKDLATPWPAHYMDNSGLTIWRQSWWVATLMISRQLRDQTWAARKERNFTGRE